MIKQVSKYISLFVSLLIVVLVLSGCSASKFIPEGKFLLDDAEIRSDVKDVNPDRLKAYIRQKGNSKWFSLFKIPLGTYALSGKDSTKWINKKLRTGSNRNVSTVAGKTMPAHWSCTLK